LDKLLHQQGYNRPSRRKLRQRSLPTMMWSCSTIDSAAAAPRISRVMARSAAEGVGSPLGWLCTTQRG